MKSFEELSATYQIQHQSQTNRLMHYIGIPAVIFGLFILLSWISINFGVTWRVDFSWIALIAAAIYYFRLGHYKLAIITSLVLIVMLLIAGWIAGPSPSTVGVVLFVIFFVGGCVCLFIGNGMEKSKTALTHSAWEVIIAPLCLIDELLALFGLNHRQ